MTSFKTKLRFVGPAVIRYFWIGLGLGILLSGIELSFAFLVQAFLLRLGAAGSLPGHLPEVLARASFTQVLTALIFCGLLRAFFLGFRDFANGAISEHYAKLQRSRMVAWVFRASSVNSAKISNLFNDRITRSSGIVTAIQRCTVLIVVLCALGTSLFMMSWSLTLYSLGSLGILSYLLRKIDHSSAKIGKGLIAEWDLTNNRLILGAKNLLLLQIYGTQETERAAAENNLGRLLKHSLSFHRLLGAKGNAPQAIGIVVICAIAYFSAKSEILMGGALLSYFYLFVRFVQSGAEFAASSTSIQVSLPQITAVYDWWQEHEKPEPPSRFALPAVPASPLGKVGWRVRDLRFTYPDDDRRVIDGLSFDVHPGQALVIVGPSGVGKSTLLSLLIGALKPTAGSVALDDGSGGALRSVEAGRASLLASLGYVGPESFLIDGTIAENLSYGLTQPASPQALEQAIEIAECGFIRQLPQGLHHRITEQGQGLSAGQKQRLALARALLRQPRALILDEATANLDLATEARLIESLRALKGKLTLVAVTHREGLLSLADQVLRLQ